MSITAPPTSAASIGPSLTLSPLRLLLHLEGVAVLAAATWLYFTEGGLSPWLFLLMPVIFDLSMVGYLANRHLGAALYNAGHSYAGPVTLGAVGIATTNDALIAVALLWLAHIGMDRALGYGLKSSKGFKHTHLQQVGE